MHDQAPMRPQCWRVADDPPARPRQAGGRRLDGVASLFFVRKLLFVVLWVWLCVSRSL
jgi:hypothetical protein